MIDVLALAVFGAVQLFGPHRRLEGCEFGVPELEVCWLTSADGAVFVTTEPVIAVCRVFREVRVPLAASA